MATASGTRHWRQLVDLSAPVPRSRCIELSNPCSTAFDRDSSNWHGPVIRHTVHRRPSLTSHQRTTTKIWFSELHGRLRTCGPKFENKVPKDQPISSRTAPLTNNCASCSEDGRADLEVRVRSMSIITLAARRDVSPILRFDNCDDDGASRRDWSRPVESLDFQSRRERPTTRWLLHGILPRRSSVVTRECQRTACVACRRHAVGPPSTASDPDAAGPTRGDSAEEENRAGVENTRRRFDIPLSRGTVLQRTQTHAAITVRCCRTVEW